MMKRTTLSSRIRLTLAFMISACIAIITIAGASPAAHAKSTIDIVQCHDSQYSQYVTSVSDSDSKGNFVYVELRYCPAYQSVYARVEYESGSYEILPGTCSVSGVDGQWRGGCTDGLPLGGPAIDTQVTASSPNESWIACWTSAADGWQLCTRGVDGSV